MQARKFYPDQVVRRLNGLSVTDMTPRQRAVLAFSRRLMPIGRAALTVSVVDGAVSVGAKKVTLVGEKLHVNAAFSNKSYSFEF